MSSKHFNWASQKVIKSPTNPPKLPKINNRNSRHQKKKISQSTLSEKTSDSTAKFPTSIIKKRLKAYLFRGELKSRGYHIKIMTNKSSFMAL